jgi:UbiD family decarboxylase
MYESKLSNNYSFLEKDLIRVKKEVSVKLEVAKLIKKAKGKPILFENVRLKDGGTSKYPILANIAGSRDLIAKYFDIKKEEILPFLAKAIDDRKKPEVVRPDGYEEISVNLDELPLLFHYQNDGGFYITAGIVIADDAEYGLNASYHRMMQIGKDELVIRILPRHLYKYIERGLKKFSICIGNTPEILIASAMSPEIGVSELDIANALKKIKLVKFDEIIATNAEIVMIAEITGEEHDEGPFVDLTETYDIVRKQPVIKVRRIYVKKDAFYHAILPGDFEHKILMGMPREPTILREVKKAGVECKNVYVTLGGASWLHCVVQIRKKSEEDGKKAIEAAFRGHSSLKLVVVVEEDVNIYEPNDVEWSIATRVQADRDVYIFPKQTGSSLDPSANQSTRETTKWGIDATIHNPERRSEFVRVS